MYQKFQASQIFTGTELLDNQLVLITQKDGTVEALVEVEEAGEEVQNFEGILTPGFINAHCHLELSHMKGMIDAYVGLQEFVKQVVALRKTDETIIEEAIEQAEEEMYKGGIVAVGDICNTLDTLSIKEKYRLAYYCFIELYDLDPTRAYDKVKAGVHMQDTFQDKCIRAALVPHAPYSVSFNLWKLLTNYFGSNTISMHNQETKDENEFFEKKSGSFLSMYERTKVSLDFFEPTGLSSLQSVLPYFKKATRSILVHNSFTSKEDIQAVQKEMPNSFWCLCPNANWYIEKTLPPIDLLRSQNATIVLGTDSYASNWSLSIIDEIKTIQKHFSSIALAEILGWATINGARALQMESTFGSFEKGKKPGVVLLEGIDVSGEILKTSNVRRLI